MSEKMRKGEGDDSVSANNARGGAVCWPLLPEGVLSSPACSGNKSKANKTMREHHVINEERKNFSQQQVNKDKNPLDMRISPFSFKL